MLSRPRFRCALFVAVLSALPLVVVQLPATASTLAAPTNPAATFDGWSNGRNKVTVSWDAVDGAETYTVGWLPGAHTVDDIGSGFWLADAINGATSISSTLTQAGLISFVIQANGSTGSGPRVVTQLTLPGPTLTAAPANGSADQADLSWASAFADDSLDVRYATTNYPTATTGTPINTGAGNSAHLTGLLPNQQYYVSAFETDSSDPTATAPEVRATFATVPMAEHDLQVHTRDWDGQPTEALVEWSPPAGCTYSSAGCDLAWVVVNPGNHAASDPSDGTLVTTDAPFNTAGQGLWILHDLPIGSTWTITLFRTNDGTHWSAPTSLIYTNRLNAWSDSMTADPASAATLGDVVKLTYHMTDPYGSPTGTVTFQTNHATSTHDLCPPAPLSADGTATCTTSALEIAQAMQEQYETRLIFANYSGDANFESSDSYFIDYDLSKALPAQGVTHSASPSVRRTLIVHTVLTGKVGMVTGKVTMMSGTKTLCRGARLRSGRVSCSIAGSRLGHGLHYVSIKYAGDGRYRARSKKVGIRLAR